jgi:FtsH-binding integral membrane protein
MVMRQFSLDSNWAQTFRLYVILLLVAAIGAAASVLLTLSGLRSPFLLIGMGLAGLAVTFVAWRAVEDRIAARRPRELLVLGSYASSNVMTLPTRAPALSTATLTAAAVSMIIVVGPRDLPVRNETSVDTQLVTLGLS